MKQAKFSEDTQDIKEQMDMNLAKICILIPVSDLKAQCHIPRFKTLLYDKIYSFFTFWVFAQFKTIKSSEAGFVTKYLFMSLWNKAPGDPLNTVTEPTQRQNYMKTGVFVDALHTVAQKASVL